MDPMIYANNLEKYLEEHSSPEDAILTKIYRETYLNMLNPRMVAGHIQGLLLSFLSEMIQPSSILEIGTFSGYSAICLAKGLAKGGVLHTIDVDDECLERANGYFKEAGLENAIKSHHGNAIDIIPTLNKTFDIIFIDGEKSEYPEYLNVSLTSLKSGGYIIADNILWNGKVIDPSQNQDKSSNAVRLFNKMIHDNQNLVKVFLPLRDGLLIARQK
jgi:predicted O-methyltransferase YrrM